PADRGTDHTRHGQGHGVTWRQGAAISVRTATADLALIENGDISPQCEQMVGTGQTDHTTTENQYIRFVVGHGWRFYRVVANPGRYPCSSARNRGRCVIVCHQVTKPAPSRLRGESRGGDSTARSASPVQQGAPHQLEVLVFAITWHGVCMFHCNSETCRGFR